ncbi:MAG: penicillin-binding transpeptidase domain-containing protein [Patescibacteria group bacterium]|nr:penicillin-binding transpeptidase domain-containing protein [Patescibacteria group bacterium]
MKTDFLLEEAVMDDFSKSLDSIEIPVAKKAFNIVIFFTFTAVAVVFARVAYLAIKEGKFYQNRAIANISDITTIPAERGIFFDRFNKPLVKNIPSFKATLKLSDFLRKSSEEQNNKAIKMAEILNLNINDFNGWLKEIDYEKQNSVVLARDLSIEQVAQIKNLNLSGVSIENDFTRQYDEPGVFSHALGYVGVASSDDFKENPKLILNDIVGKSGLELVYNENLKGENGEIIEYRNAKNENLKQNSVIAPRQGNNLYLTIDGDLQTFFYATLKNQLETIGRDSGAGIVINPQTGEILSLVSLPSFDNNKIDKNVLINPSHPLFNRVVSGVYNPGSTIKPLVAIAALKENVISPLKEILSIGYIEIPNPYYPESSSRFVDWKPQGWVNVYSALARSSNVYFYEVGGGYGDIKGLGIEKLREYWQKFGLDQKTGIDLPGEKTGFLPDIEEKWKRTGTFWRLGDTYNVSIGQGDLMVTPLELINYISSVAGRGKFYQPFLVKSIVNEKRNVIKNFDFKIIRDNSYLADEIKEVEKGMIDCSQKDYGTAYMLHDLPFVVAAKTGSAQIENNKKTNAFFAGYNTLPIETDKTQTETGKAPQQIAVLVLIENAREGSLNAIPVAKKVFQWYYNNRLNHLKIAN